MPAGSKMNLSLAKAKPIRGSGSTSGITELRSRKKNGIETAAGERTENVRGTTLQMEVSGEGGGGGAPGARAEIPVQLVVRKNQLYFGDKRSTDIVQQSYNKFCVQDPRSLGMELKQKSVASSQLWQPELVQHYRCQCLNHLMKTSLVCLHFKAAMTHHQSYRDNVAASNIEVWGLCELVDFDAMRYDAE
ncbi:hypothetical protein WISP_20370 [Willisornis vidua]|uniref:Uncharacterized protein n=1 Tax=Willisornis vidua TaxID=1566151 RepID=A0ABQ9DU05_9PASS|nr:hypothetical protein WISP_20370 [Willisornis vidua]